MDGLYGKSIYTWMMTRGAPSLEEATIIVVIPMAGDGADAAIGYGVRCGRGRECCQRHPRGSGTDRGAAPRRSRF